MLTKIDNYSLKIYSIFLSKDFPLLLSIVYLSAFITDIMYAFQVLYNNKSYFILYESNLLLKYSLKSGNWFVYPIFSILFYLAMIFISKKYPNPTLRSLLLAMGLLQLGMPLIMVFSVWVFTLFYLLIFITLHYPLIYLSNKNKKKAL